MRLQSINTLRSQEWSRAYLWDIEFPTFGKFFPAVDVEENLATIQNQEYTFYQSTYKTPFRTTFADVKVTFIEYADHSVSKWLTEYINVKILGDGNFVQTVEDASIPCNIYKLNPDRSVLSVANYLVIPDGELSFHGSSDSATETVTLSFIITGS